MNPMTGNTVGVLKCPPVCLHVAPQHQHRDVDDGENRKQQ